MDDLTKLTADELRVRFDVLRPKLNVPARLVLAEISRRLERLEKCEAALEEARKAINALIPFAEYAFPKLPHEGPCTPESGCDAICMEAASLSGIIRMAYRIVDAARAAAED